MVEEGAIFVEHGMSSEVDPMDGSRRVLGIGEAGKLGEDGDGRAVIVLTQIRGIGVSKKKRMKGGFGFKIEQRKGEGGAPRFTG